MIRARFDSIKRYVDFLPMPTGCPSCKAPTSTQTHPPGHPELPWYVPCYSFIVIIMSTIVLQMSKFCTNQALSCPNTFSESERPTLMVH